MMRRYNPQTQSWYNDYYVQDGLGHTRLLLDGNGNVINRYAYDAWGNLIEYVENVPNPFTWNGAYGYEWIAITGLYHIGAREYDPRTGRWLQRDPIDASSGDPNFWRYCGNDPLNSVDPTGTEVNPYLDAGISLIPVVGGLWDIGHGLYERDWMRAGLGVVSLVSDAFTLGGGSAMRASSSAMRLAHQAGAVDFRVLTYTTGHGLPFAHNVRGVYHHIYPRKFTNQFMKECGIDVDQHTLLIPENFHVNILHGGGGAPGGWYNTMWENWFTGSRSAKDAREHATNLLKHFGLDLDQEKLVRYPFAGKWGR